MSNSKCVVYADEAGHASPDHDPNFPCFVLACCLFEKKEYCSKIVPSVQKNEVLASKDIKLAFEQSELFA